MITKNGVTHNVSSVAKGLCLAQYWGVIPPDASSSRVGYLLLGRPKQVEMEHQPTLLHLSYSECPDSLFTTNTNYKL